ncbi:toxin-antitoxin system YwqK family antitoxin [Xanthomarina sp. F2636L]|uniref:toxin-antitoxin system YwqK family antitoxin n=1 Tax=Xanthomarina sp. F2636L TaxID=2996018 RepID=UPI00225DD661|nr:hypothetical protein [Xanthomarina sp. F2636L]MCX7549326.1 hypothetical protein [Xanthomarina sp. F2636L]
MNLKHLTTLFCLIFCVLLSTAQKPRKVKKVSEKLSFSTAKYEVLKSNKNKKHGFYKEYDDYYRRLIVSGQYDLGKKEGLWKEWYQSEDLKSEGNYLNDEEVGVWVFYDDTGNLLHKYDYDSKTLLYSKECGNDKEYEILIKEESVWKTLDCPPSILGGMNSLTVDSAYIFSKSRFNVKEVGGIYANISIHIRKDGTVGEMKANNSFLNSDYIAILEDAINNKEVVWLPAELDGEKVDAYVNFKSSITSSRRTE